MTYKRKKHPTKCIGCGEEFLAYKKGKATKKYCTSECRYKSTSKKKEYFCENCGDSIIRTPGNIKNKIYCSKKCSDQGKINVSINTKEKVDFKCPICENTIKIYPYELNSRKTCSKKCLGKLHSLRGTETKECFICKKEVTRVSSRIKRGKVTVCSNSCLAEYIRVYQVNSGENHPNYKGGGEKYYGPTWREARRKRRKIDSYKCRDCGLTESESISKYKESLSVHHLKPYVLFSDSKKANNIENLITVCKSCHAKRHSGELHPSKYLKDVIGVL